MLASLAERGFRGIAVQAPMAEAMELDRYVQTGAGNPSQWLRALGPHWHTQDILALVEWIRGYNRNRAMAEQIHFYGFELPTAGHALQVLTSLPDSVAGRPLNLWLRQQLQCVSTGESAAWGREGPAADSAFWNRCRGATAAVVDSLGALRGRLASIRGNALAGVTFAEQMARLAQHDADVGLRRLPRHEAVAEHIMWLLNGLGADGNLLVWGRDVESGRLTAEGGLVQSAVPLARVLGDRYRNMAFTAAQGTIRAQPINVGQREPGGETNMRLRPPRRESYEDVLNRASGEILFVDMRAAGPDTAGTWLKGPHQGRLISGVYSENALGVFETSLQFPRYYDGVLFAKHVNAAIPLKR
jgi:erythromycin esterase